MDPRYGRPTFHCTAARLEQLPPDEGREVAFVGRSNAGKSSAINAIAGVGGLARTSRTPGRTRALVFFALDDTRRLVDLPGYGYAKAPKSLAREWAALVEAYLRRRHALVGLVVVMDARRPFLPVDESLLGWREARGLPAHVLLTKADKLGRAEAARTLAAAERKARSEPVPLTVQLFSANRRMGLEQARARLDHWFAWERAKKYPGSTIGGEGF